MIDTVECSVGETVAIKKAKKYGIRRLKGSMIKDTYRRCNNHSWSLC